MNELLVLASLREAPAELPERLSCDAKYLARALVNVLRNAVRLHPHSAVRALDRLAVEDRGLAGERPPTWARSLGHSGSRER